MKAQANPNTISDVMRVFSSLTRVFFYSMSSKSSISTSFTLYINQELSPLKHKLVVVTSLGEQIISTFVFRGCEVLIKVVNKFDSIRDVRF